MLHETTTDPIVVSAFALAVAFVIGLLTGRRYPIKIETTFTFELPKDSSMKVKVNRGGRIDNETPDAHVDL